MKYPTTILALALTLTALVGCSKNPWPSGVVEGATISISVVGGGGGVSRGTVVRVEGDWVTITTGSREYTFQRDKVTALIVH